jgi:hypothetical protein
MLPDCSACRCSSPSRNAKGLGPTVPELHAGAADTAHKVAFDACRHGGFLDRLPVRHDIVVCGCETHVCVLQTVFGLLRAGDGCSSPATPSARGGPRAKKRQSRAWKRTASRWSPPRWSCSSGSARRKIRDCARYSRSSNSSPHGSACYLAAAAYGCAAAAGWFSLRNPRTCRSAIWICLGFAFHG